MQRDCMMTAHGHISCVEAPPAPARGSFAVFVFMALVIAAVLWGLRRVLRRA